MGVVYRARDPRTQQVVALKVLLAGRWADSVLTERFLREAKAASRLEHPGLVRVIESGEVQGQRYLAMNLIPGPSLREVIDDGGVGVDEAVRITLLVARALDYAHRAGVTHRDVKPENILLDDQRQPVLTDFGLVLELSDARLTHTGQVMGTPAYLAPELARGLKEPDWPSCDVYALGAVFYELLTGVPVYDGDAAMQVLLDVLAGPPPTPISLVPSLPPALNVLVLRALARDQDSRLSSAGALADDLQRYLDGQQIQTRPLSSVYMLRQWASSNQRALAIGASALAVVAAISATFVGTDAQQSAAARQLREDNATTTWQEVARQIEDFEREGQRLEADAAFSAWHSLDSWSGTAAWSASWAHRSHLLDLRRDAPGAIDAAARGWVGDEDPTRKKLARNRLVTLLAADWRDEAAYALRDDNVQPQVAISQRHTEGAPTWLRDLVAQATRLPDTSQIVEMVDGDWLVRTAEGGTLLSRDFIEQTPVEALPEVFLPVTADLAITWSAGQATLSRVSLSESPALKPLLTWAESRPTDAISTDGASIFVAIGPYARKFIRLDQVDGAWQRSDAHHDTTLAGSDVMALELLATTPTQIAAAIGPWNAYDVRLFEDSEDGLTLIARQKIGYVSDLASLHVGEQHVLAALKTQQYPSRRAFAADRPFGLDAGVHLFDLENALEPVQVLTLDGPHWLDKISGSRLRVADLDGDGRDDLIAEVQVRGLPHLLLAHQQPDARFKTYRLAGLTLYATANLDQDPAAELIIGTRDANELSGASWVLGLGTETLPPRLATAVPPEATDTETAQLLGLFLDQAPRTRIDNTLDHVIQFSDPMLDSWQLPAPLALHRDIRRGTLTADASVGLGVLARLPIRRTQGPIALQVTLDLERLEWASGIAVQLVKGDERIGISLTGWGGGALLQRQLGCPGPGIGATGHRTAATPADFLEVVATASFDPNTEILTCHFVDSNGQTLHHSARPMTLPGAGDWWLEITDAGAQEVDTPMWARVSLHEIKLAGVLPMTDDTGLRSARRWVEGDAKGALASEPSGLLRAAILATLGRPTESTRAVLNTPIVQRNALLRAQPTLGPQLLRPALGDQWFPTWHRTHTAALQTHPQDTLLQSRVLSDLTGLGAWRPKTAEERGIQAALLFTRGRTRWLTGTSTPGDARSDLVQAVQQAPDALLFARERQDADSISEAITILVDGHALLTTISLATGQRDQALEHARASLEWAPSPTVAADRLLLDPRVQAQLGEAAWKQLFDL